ncbi:unnamed protein product, partial [marine sediment metagenome]
GTIEELTQLAGSVEKGRRRAAASLSAADWKERDQAQNEAPPQTPQEIRNQIRRGMTRIGSR